MSKYETLRCEVDGCTKKTREHPFCRSHRQALKRHGNLQDVDYEWRFIDRILSRITVTETCWLWTGQKISNGYAGIKYHGRNKGVHVILWELWNGPIPEGKELDHLCRTPLCVNTDHLEPVTHIENIRRGDSPIPKRAFALSCESGHAFTERNTDWDRGGRRCRSCRTQSAQKIAWLTEGKPLTQAQFILLHPTKATIIPAPDFRAKGLPKKQVRPTHCKRGHEFSVENTRVDPNGYWHCKRCQEASRREWRKRQAQNVSV